MEVERIELQTPYQIMRGAATRIMAVKPEQVNFYFHLITEDLERLQMSLISFSRVDLQIDEQSFQRLVCDVSYYYSQFVPIWPTPFLIFIYNQLNGRGKNLQDYLAYVRELIQLNQNHRTKWTLKQNGDSPNIVVYDKANEDAVKLVEESSAGSDISDELLKNFNPTRTND